MIDSTEGSILLIGIVVFVGESSRGILFPSLWSLCRTLGGNTVDLGYLVGTFSLGRLLMTPLLSYLCDRQGHKVSLILANIILAIGAVLWANTYIIGDIRCLYIAQLLLGIGSGSLGVTRSFISERTELRNRTGMLANITAIQYAGFTISPIIGSALIFIVQHSTIVNNQYPVFALPAYMITFMAFFVLTSLYISFRDTVSVAVIDDEVVADLLDDFEKQSPSSLEEDLNTKTSLNDKDNNINLNHTVKTNMLTMIIFMLLLNITLKGSIAVYETLGAQIAIDNHGMSMSTLGVMISLSGAVGSIQLLAFSSFWSKYFTDIQLILGGMGIMIIAQFIFVIPIFQSTSIIQYITSTVLMYAIGYPIGHTALLGLFSKIQKSGKHSIMMGWFAAVGSLSRIVFPIGTSYLNQYINNGAFLIVLVLLIISFVGVVNIKLELMQVIERSHDLTH